MILVGQQKFPDSEPNVNGQLNTMDGQYVPTVTPIDIEGVDKTSKDIQGATQKETPTFNTTATNLMVIRLLLLQAQTILLSW